MPLLVTSASGANGDGFGTLLAFELDGRLRGTFIPAAWNVYPGCVERLSRLRGTFIDDERVADPRGLAVDPKEDLLFLNSGADRVLADLRVDKMPAEAYSFRTTPQVRSFAEMIAHVTDAQLRMCGVVKGETPTANAGSKSTKVALVMALKASFDYCDPVYEAMTDSAGAARVRWARWEMSKLGLLNWNISHDNEMYGILGAFLRLKGLVPATGSEGYSGEK